jgi:hypothetical protein
LVLSLIGPGSVLVGAARPAFTIATMAPAILSRNASMSAALRPETASSFALAIPATESPFASAWASSSFIVAYGYLGCPFSGGR